MPSASHGIVEFTCTDSVTGRRECATQRDQHGGKGSSHSCDVRRPRSMLRRPYSCDEACAASPLLTLKHSFPLRRSRSAARFFSSGVSDSRNRPFTSRCSCSSLFAARLEASRPALSLADDTACEGRQCPRNRKRQRVKPFAELLEQERLGRGSSQGTGRGEVLLRLPKSHLLLESQRFFLLELQSPEFPLRIVPVPSSVGGRRDRDETPPSGRVSRWLATSSARAPPPCWIT